MNKRREEGVGLIEAMIALAVLIFSLAVSVSMMTESVQGMQFTKIHLEIDSFSDEISGIILSDATAAKAGSLNVLFSEANPIASATALKVAEWRDRVSTKLDDGDSQIQCTLLSCDVSLSWSELIDGSWTTQTFQLKIPV